MGVIAGGTRANVVPAGARTEVDLRVSTMEEADRVVPMILGLKPHLPGAQVEVTGGLNRPPMERTPGSVALFRQARAIAAQLGLKLREAGTGGGSDGNFTAAPGVPTLDGLEVVGEGAHARHEQVMMPRLPQRAALLAGLLTRV